MRWCCPPGHGCNSPDGSEPCALEVFRAASADDPDARLALERWDALQRACEHRRNDNERRFRRRAFERARDQALIGRALHAGV
jgi:hypothetical protein